MPCSLVDNFDHGADEGNTFGIDGICQEITSNEGSENSETRNIKLEPTEGLSPIPNNDTSRSEHQSDQASDCDKQLYQLPWIIGSGQSLPIVPMAIGDQWGNPTDISFDQVNVDMGQVAVAPVPRITTTDDTDGSPKPCNGRDFDCIEKRLRKVFAAWGRIVARYPWPIFLIPIFVTMVLSSGFLFIHMETDQEVLYTPINGQAKTERKMVEELFKSVSWEAHTTPARLTRVGRFVQIIFTRTHDEQNAINSNLLEKAFDIHDTVLNHKIKGDNGFTYEYDDLCIMWHGSCLANTVLTLYEDNLNYFDEDNITYPYTFLPDGNVGFLGAELGGVELWDKDEFEPEFSPVKSATAFRLLYYLKSDGEYNDISAEFESFVMHAVEEMSSDWSDVSAIPFASRTADDEVQAATFDSMTLFPIAAVLLLVFTIGSCMTRDPVRSKPWLALAAIVSTLLAMLSAPGLLFFFGVPFVDMAASMPFIIIGRGLDDAFIMLAAWRQTDTNFSVERRMSLSLADAVMSITATTVTDSLAFLIGGISDFRSVRIFCFYTGLAVVFDYIYQITFFAACMVFSGTREAEGRHCITMRRIREPSHYIEKKDLSLETSPSKDKYAYSAGQSEHGDGKVDHAFMTFFRDTFGPLIMKPWIKVIVFLIYLGYIGGALWGCVLVKQGLTEQNLVREGSKANQFIDLKYEYFKTYEPAVSIVIKTEQNYWEPGVQDVINRTLSELQESEHFHDSSLTISWLHEYQRFLGLVGIQDINQDLFMSILRDQFLQIPAYEPFKLDIVFDETNTSILSSRFIVMGKDLFSSEEEKAMMIEARRVVANCEFPAISYSPSFIYFDQFIAVIPTTAQNMALAIGSIIFASFLLIPSATCCIWVTFAVISILVGVVGYMTFWDVNLHSMSLLTLILAVGFSVDYTIHITSAFVSASGLRRRDRAIHALYSVGMPIVQGSLSTIFAIFLFAFSTHYAFRVFFKSITLVILFGIAHGLVFLPVVLSVFGPRSKPTVQQTPQKSKPHESAS